MARPARIIFEGAYYHVINRGQAKRKVYLDKKDYKAFLNVLSDACQIYGVDIIAYCLMGNHYHLLVKTPNANLSDFMRQLNGVYTQIFNRRYKRDGSLFKGRYKANVVQEGSYLLRLIRYIHRNPVRAKMRRRCEDYVYERGRK
jgi:putative transposase